MPVILIEGCCILILRSRCVGYLRRTQWDPQGRKIIFADIPGLVLPTSSRYLETQRGDSVYQYKHVRHHEFGYLHRVNISMGFILDVVQRGRKAAIGADSREFIYQHTDGRRADATCRRQCIMYFPNPMRAV